MSDASFANRDAVYPLAVQAERALEPRALNDEVVIVDDDPMVNDLLSMVFQSAGYRVTTFADGQSFTRDAKVRVPACIILDVCMPGRSGLDILKDIDAHNYPAPIIIISGRASIPIAVEAIKNGAIDIIEKPFSPDTILKRVREVIDAWSRRRETAATSKILTTTFSGCPPLTMREAEVLAEILAAASNKEAASHLGISPRTVEVHRARIMMKLGAKNAADLVRIALSKRAN
jgi:two-component system response regulator FixJ